MDTMSSALTVMSTYVDIGDGCADVSCVIVLPSRSGCEALVAAAAQCSSSPLDGDTLSPCSYGVTSLSGGGWSHVWVIRARAVDAQRCASLLECGRGEGVKSRGNRHGTRVVAVGMDIARVAAAWALGCDDISVYEEARAAFDQIDDSAACRSGEAGPPPLRILLIGNADMLSPRGDVVWGGVGGGNKAQTKPLSEAQCAALFCFARTAAFTLRAAFVAAPGANSLTDALVASTRALLRGNVENSNANNNPSANAPPHRSVYAWGVDTCQAAAAALGRDDRTWATDLAGLIENADASTSTSTLLLPPSFRNAGAGAGGQRECKNWARAAESNIHTLATPAPSAPTLEVWAAALALAMPTDVVCAGNGRASAAPAAPAPIASGRASAASAGVGPRAAGARRSLGGLRASLGGAPDVTIPQPLPISALPVAPVPADPPPPHTHTHTHTLSAKDPKAFFSSLLSNAPRAPRAKK